MFKSRQLRAYFAGGDAMSQRGGRAGGGRGGRGGGGGAAAVRRAHGQGNKQPYLLLIRETDFTLKTSHTLGRKFPELLADEAKNLSTGVHRPKDAVSVGFQ